MRNLLALAFILISHSAYADQPLDIGQTVNNTVSKALGDFYIQVVTLQTQLNVTVEENKNLQAELDKCHKDGCKTDPKSQPPKSK